MNRWKLTGLMALIVLSNTSTTAIAAGKMSGNITATSTYLWRGVAMTADSAIQGGVGYSAPEGIHAGVWTSNVFAGSQLNAIAGFAGKASGIGYDVGLTIYNFSQYEAAGADVNFNELYASGTMGALNARVSLSSDAGSYLEVNGNFPKVAAGWDLGLHLGSYDVDKDYGASGITYGGLNEDYTDYSASLGTKMDGFDMKFVLSNTNLPDDSYRTIVTLSKNFKP